MTYHAKTIAWVTFAFALLSLICSILTLVIIRNIGQWNGYLLVIVTLAYTQLVYDVSFMLRVSPDYPSCVAEHFLWYFAGLSVTIWTNVLIFLICYVMIYCRTIDIMKNFNSFFAVATLAPLGLSVWSVFYIKYMTDDDDGNKSSLQYQRCRYENSVSGNIVLPVYYWIRIVSIFINLFGFLFSKYRLSQLGIVQLIAPITEQGRKNSSSQNSLSTRSNLAMAVLVGRVKYYPLAQLFCRIGAAWNEYDNYRYSSPVSAYLSAILSPSLGICLFGIFLWMQPKAWTTFLRLMGIKEEINVQDDDSSLDEKFSFNNSSPEMFEYLPEHVLDLIISFDASTVRITDEQFDSMVSSSSLSRSGSLQLEEGSSKNGSQSSGRKSGSARLEIQQQTSFTTNNPINHHRDKDDDEKDEGEHGDPGLFL